MKENLKQEYNAAVNLVASSSSTYPNIKVKENLNEKDNATLALVSFEGYLEQLLNLKK